MLLLDTCILIWLDASPDLISENARRAIRESAASLFVSSFSALEIALKCRKGKLALPDPPKTWFPGVLAAHGIAEIPMNGEIALRSASLPAIHADPADRVIVATAQMQSLRLVTPDPLIHAYPDTDYVW